MPSFLPHKISDQTFLLSANRTVFWEEEKTLILSDLHLGKSGHFRKSGIAIPQTVFKEDMQRLLAELSFFSPKKILIVGDLFHSKPNREHDFFLRWRNDLPHTEIHLVKGNHDILSTAWYENAGIVVHPQDLLLKDFLFTHDIATCEERESKYCFSGHIHPGIYLKGLGKLAVTLPCFYFAKSYAVLPAFGKFTGTFPVKPTTGDHVFVLAEGGVMQIC